MLDQLEFDETKYQKDLKESRERKPVKVVTEVAGISKGEQYSSSLRSGEEYTRV